MGRLTLHVNISGTGCSPGVLTFRSMCIQAVISDRNEEGKRSDVVEQYEFQRKCSIVI